MKLLLRITLNSLLGLALIFIWSKFVDLNQIIQKISEANFFYLIPAFVCLFASPFIRAIRLKLFLWEIKKIPLMDLFFLNGAALLLNFLIPIRAGEVAKGVYLNSRYGLKLGKSVIWIFLDRFIDLLTVLTFTVLLLVIIPTSLGTTFIKAVAVILIPTLLLTYLTVYKIDFTKKLINFLMPLLIEKHIKIYFERFSHFILESFSILRRRPKDLGLLFVLSIISYAADAGGWYFMFASLNSPQDFFKMYLGQLLSALTYLIPAAPGYVGSAEASGTLILSGVFGIDVNLSSSMIVLFHITTAILVIIFGLISIFSLKLDLGLIFRKVLKRS